MRIGIIGATGFIGTALGREAVQRGHSAVVFTRKDALSLPWAAEVRPVMEEGPVIDPAGIDALVNLAGENIFGLWTEGKRRRIRESRITLTRRIVAALKECRERPGVFACASAAGYYGDRGDEVLREDSSRGEGFLADVCADWEKEAGQAAALGLRVVKLRTGMVLGREGGAWPLLKRVFKMRLGARLGNGRQWMPWIHIDDEVGIILHALENPDCAGPVNLTAPAPVTNMEFTRAVCEVLRRPAFFPVPAFFLKLALREFSTVMLNSLRVLPGSAFKQGHAFRHPELADALATLV